MQRPRLQHAALVFLFVLAASALAMRVEAVRAVVVDALETLRIVGPPVRSGPPELSGAEIDQLAQAPPQLQAERLLERAITGWTGASAWIETNVDPWRGAIEETPTLRALLNAALNHTDLRVRAVGIEVWLAAWNVEKTEEQVVALVEDVERDPGRRPWSLYALGLLANRGVEPDWAHEVLRDHLDHDDEDTRHWAVEGLAYSGDPRQLEELLRVFRDDPSPRIQERAACSLAQSGMLRAEHRMRAAPSLYEIGTSPDATSAQRRWTFQALRDISGRSFGDDARAWRDWLDQR